jgi:hypothetical protein
MIGKCDKGSIALSLVEGTASGDKTVMDVLDVRERFFGRPLCWCRRGGGTKSSGACCASQSDMSSSSGDGGREAVLGLFCATFRRSRALSRERSRNGGLMAFWGSLSFLLIFTSRFGPEGPPKAGYCVPFEREYSKADVRLKVEWTEFARECSA